MSRLLRLLAVVLAATVAAGCATTSVFSPYPLQAAAFRQAAGGLETGPVLARLDQKRTGNDRLLYLLERGRIAQLQGDFTASQADFAQAIDVFRANEDRAMLTLSGAGATGGALLTNDNAIPYKGYGYERVMAHQFQAFNYLGLGDAEAATVELRRAAQVQRELELKYEDEIGKTREDANRNQVGLGDYDRYFTGMDALTGHLKNSFQNGYTFYTSAVIWEALGEYNSALVDYKKALELSPGNARLREDVIRADRGDAPAQATGTVVVLFEQGFVPGKRPVGLAIPTLDGGIFTIQFPVYDGSDYVPPSPLAVRADDGTRAETALLVDTGALAVKALREQVPGMLVRQALRARAKYEMQKKAAEQGGVGGQFLANIYNLVSEQADLRSWLTLPGNAQAVRLALPPGTRQLEFASYTGSLSLPVEVRPGRTVLVRVVEVNGRMLTQTFAL